MADIALTAAQIAAIDPQKAEILPMIAAAAITAGQALYQDANGKADLADANGSGTLQFRGIALNAAAAGQPVSVLKRGRVYGYTISSLAYDAPVFLSNTAGAFADGAGGTSVSCGSVGALTDGSTLTKVLYIDADYLRTWA